MFFHSTREFFQDNCRDRDECGFREDDVGQHRVPVRLGNGTRWTKVWPSVSERRAWYQGQNGPWGWRQWLWRPPGGTVQGGRPITRKIEIHVAAEQVAKATFTTAKPLEPNTHTSPQRAESLPKKC